MVVTNVTLNLVDSKIAGGLVTCFHALRMLRANALQIYVAKQSLNSISCRYIKTFRRSMAEECLINLITHEEHLL